MPSTTMAATTRVQFVPVGRQPREWMWKVREKAGNTIAISGHRFASLTEAVRDARLQILGEADEGPIAA